LLACVNQSASLHAPLSAASHFCVNVLQKDQTEVAHAFSNNKLREVRFATGNWQIDERGPPYLVNALASFICLREQVIAFATHSICIGSVCEIRMRDGFDPLVYIDGRFTSVEGLPHER
jgi:flavin reductase (DIM6/NTAB) family NADH-FMN oxidoreductase RutF